MIGWAVTFLFIGMVAGLLGLTGTIDVAIHVAWLLFVAALILLALSAVLDRAPRMSGGP